MGAGVGVVRKKVGDMIERDVFVEVRERERGE